MTDVEKALSEAVKDPRPLFQQPRKKVFNRWWKSIIVFTSAYATYALLFETPDLHRLSCHRHRLTDSEIKLANQHADAYGLDRASAEQLFLTIPDEQSALATSKKFTSTPHMAGTDEDLRTAKDLLAIIQTELGIETDGNTPIYDAGSDASRNATLGIIDLQKPSAWIDTYYPLLNAPTGLSTLEIVDAQGETVWTAELSEQVPENGSSPIERKYSNAIPPFHGYSKGGSAEGGFVYANFGRKEDFELLVQRGVNVTGKVVLARYGAIFRGLKVKFAQEHGAVAVLLFDDPSSDGSVTVENGYKPYPAGPARNPDSLQRGSVQFLSMYPGDPTTPGYPSYQNSTRTEGENIPNIPSLPISWNNAQRILAGDNSTRIRVLNSVDTRVKPIWNTMAAIPGHIKGEVIVLGNHRDAWVMGAADPTSGTVSIVEVIKGYGSLLRSGWKPLRTIVFASWDAEEFGLVGSTEYGEDFSEWIKEHVVAYLNLDVSVGGSKFNIQASPSLADLARGVSSIVPHPRETNRTLWDMRNDNGPYSGPIPLDIKALFDARAMSSSTGIGALGSGSDYTVFLQHLGVASIDQGAGHAANDAAYHYHSVYDSFHWMSAYADVGFHTHVALARHIGLLGLRLSDSVILPINTTRYAEELFDYIDKIESQAIEESIDIKTKSLRTTVGKTLKASKKIDAAKEKSERKLLRILKHLKECETESLNPIYRAERLQVKQSKERDRLLRKLMKTVKRIQNINSKLAGFESGFISKEGIKEREWYKHLGTAPGKNLGYGATTLPAIAEAISEDKDSKLAQAEVDRFGSLLSTMNKRLKL